MDLTARLWFGGCTYSSDPLVVGGPRSAPTTLGRTRVANLRCTKRWTNQHLFSKSMEWRSPFGLWTAMQCFKAMIGAFGLLLDKNLCAISFCWRQASITPKCHLVGPHQPKGHLEKLTISVESQTLVQYCSGAWTPWWVMANVVGSSTNWHTYLPQQTHFNLVNASKLHHTDFS